MTEKVIDIHKRIREIARRDPPQRNTELVREVFYYLSLNPSVSLVVVVDEDNRVCGQLSRKRFLEEIIIGKYGYGIHLYGTRPIFEVMERPSLIFDASLTLEEAALEVKKREAPYLYDDLIVTEEGKYFGILPVATLLEVLAQRSLQLARDANPLTGLPGNWAIKSFIEEKISQNEYFEVLYIDLNNFKPFNDKYGFAKGDEAIEGLGGILKDISFREDCFAGHIGGDDFVLITPFGLAETKAYEIIERFNNLLPTLHGKDYDQGFYTSLDRLGQEQRFPLLSLTIAIIGNKDRNITSFAHLSSIASEVKSVGKRLAKERGGSVVFKERRKDKILQRQASGKCGKDKNYYFDFCDRPVELDIYYQPIVNLKEGKVIGFEALVRGFDEETKEPIPPLQLFRIAKMEGTIVDFECLCKELALKKFVTYELGRDYLLFLNVDLEILNLDFMMPDRIAAKARHYGLDPQGIVFELSENAITSMENLQNFVKKCYNQKFYIALDDFGTRYSNLERLVSFDVQYLKLDQLLLRNVDVDDKKERLLQVLDYLAKKINCLTVAEGIERPEEMEVILRNGIIFAQGFYLAPPLCNPLEAKEIAEENLRKMGPLSRKTYPLSEVATLWA